MNTKQTAEGNDGKQGNYALAHRNFLGREGRLVTRHTDAENYQYWRAQREKHSTGTFLALEFLYLRDFMEPQKAAGMESLQMMLRRLDAADGLRL